MNYAIANYLAGRAEEAYALLRSTFAGIFNGATPGGLSCQNLRDGRQRQNADFADSASMWVRTVVEGLSRHRPEAAGGVRGVVPAIALRTGRRRPFGPLISITAGDGPIRGWAIQWESPFKTTVRLRLPVRASAIGGVTVDERRFVTRSNGVSGCTWVGAVTPSASAGSIDVAFTPARLPAPPETRVETGERLAGWTCPSGVLKDSMIRNSYSADGTLKDGFLQGTIAGDPGPAVLFLDAGGSQCPVWVPLPLHIAPAEPALPKVWQSPRLMDRDRRPWTMLDVRACFNSPLGDVPARVLAAAQAAACTRQPGWFPLLE